MMAAARLLLVVTLTMTLPGVAMADDDDALVDPAEETLGWRYLVDGGAIPFVYGSMAIAATALLFAEPPEHPRLFSDDEGGAANVGESIPDAYVAAFAGLSIVALAFPDDDSRWFHIKGMVESVLTTAALTEVAKNTFGRHRPNYDPAGTSEDDRKSFFSGHSSVTLAVTTYAGLYLHQHLFARFRRSGQALAWWEPLPFAALAGLSFYFPYTRLDENQHHLSDVLTGGGVGIASSVIFYAYQERRFRKQRRSKTDVVLVPNLREPGISLLMSF